MAYAFCRSSLTKQIAHNIILKDIKMVCMFPVI